VINRLAIGAAIAAALQGCATVPACPPAPAPKTIDTGCKWAQPIQVSKDDTADTKKLALKAWQAWHLNCDGQIKPDGK